MPQNSLAPKPPTAASCCCRMALLVVAVHVPRRPHSPAAATSHARRLAGNYRIVHQLDVVAHNYQLPPCPSILPSTSANYFNI
ncbi:hypothetical protein AYI69_g8242 [Smittium culicis]|uniref:Uncharacterized protein n=1 Tax=Smittium culicis TaxID=133412 RepID=A0A1R1XKW2_9FUNG|nr:hypothetical protein AYI69_g8242 [Smittium culicis]